MIVRVNIRIHDDPDAGPQNYAMATELTGPGRLLYISGQVPETTDGITPRNFADQAHLVWQNIEKVLAGAGMGIENLVKVTTFLSDRKYRHENSRVRQEVLGEHRPALTVIVAGIYEERWLLEIEAIAAG